MKNIVFITFAIIGLIGCKNEQKSTDYSWFKPEQKCWLTFNFTNVNEAKEYGFYYNQQLPCHQVVKRFVVESDTSIKFQLNINHGAYLHFWQQKEGIQLFLNPNDTIIVNLDGSNKKSFNESISFTGNNANIASYLKQFRKFYYGSPVKGQNAESFNEMLDSFYQVEYHKLDSVYQLKQIPAWYYPMEQANLQSDRDGFKFMQFGQHVWFNNDFIERDKSLEKSIELPDMQFQYLHNFNGLLCGFRPHKYDTLLQAKNINDAIFMQYMSDNFDELKQKQPQTDWSFFVASQLSVLFNKNALLQMSPKEFKTKTHLIDSFIQSKQHLITNKEILEFMLAHKQASYIAYHGQNHLKAGELAPNFYLKNLNGESCDLSQYKGKLVLLNFWGTYCTPCIRSIPDKNSLVEKLADHDFELVNVCMDYNPEEWKQLIHKHQFKGNQLICKGNWSENIKSKYNLKGVPHYCLVNKEGLVIQNGIHPDSLHAVIERIIGIKN